MQYIRRPEEDKIKEILTRNRMCYVCGPAGIGKTTMSKNLANELQNGVLIFLREITSVKQIERFVDKNRKQVLFLDGLDEMEKNLQKAVIKKSEGLLVKYQNIKIVITTRDKIENANYPVVVLQGFDLGRTMDSLKDETYLDENSKHLVASVTGGNPLLIRMLVESTNKTSAPIDEILSVMNDEQISSLMCFFFFKGKSFVKTRRDARIVLFQIYNFAPIKIEKLRTWNSEKNIESILEDLEKNNYITINKDKIYHTYRSVSFSNSEKKAALNHLSDVFFDSRAYALVDDRDIDILLDLLGSGDRKIKLITGYYRNKLKKTEDNLPSIVADVVKKHLEDSKNDTHMNDRYNPKIAIITALPEEYTAVERMLENVRPLPKDENDFDESCEIGEIQSELGIAHSVVLAMTIADNNTRSALCAANLIHYFPNLEVIFMVGVAGGTPVIPEYFDYSPKEVLEKHVRLGDIVVGDSVLQYDYKKEKKDGDTLKGKDIPVSISGTRAYQRLLCLIEKNKAVSDLPWNKYVNQAVSVLGKEYERPSEKSDIVLDYEGNVVPHPNDKSRIKGYPKVFCGKIASGNAVLKDPEKRDELKRKYDVYAIEMETAGVAEAARAKSIGFCAVRGISDYCDASTKNDEWHRYAALVAAAYTKALIENMKL